MAQDAPHSSDTATRDTAPGGERARLAVLELVCGQAVRGIGLSLVFLAFLCAGLREAVAAERLVAWFSVIATISAFRYAAVIGFRRRRHWLGSAGWEHAFNASLVVNASAWGVGTALLLPDLPLALQAFVFTFVIGMAGGTAALYSAQRIGASVAVVALAGPSSLVLGLQPGLEPQLLAFFGLAIVLAGQSAIRQTGVFVVRSFALTEDLARERDRAERAARTDELTGLANRRSFHQNAAYLVEQARRHGRPLALALVDVDRFKPINDEHGHAHGDRVLCAVADALVAASRQLDVVSRVGGDEFAVLLPDASAEAATRFVERFRKRLANAAAAGEAEPVSTTCSIGIAEWAGDDGIDAVLFRADRALYRAKDSGRDRLAVWSEREDA